MLKKHQLQELVEEESEKSYQYYQIAKVILQLNVLEFALKS